jgi:hypothetical protein
MSQLDGRYISQTRSHASEAGTIEKHKILEPVIVFVLAPTRTLGPTRINRARSARLGADQLLLYPSEDSSAEPT